jgi:succinate dehydrogenase / fumarate reductase cytochrome b subunit
MATSILHRATGCALYAGGLILALWAVSLASGPQVYLTFMSVLGSLLGRIVMFGITFSAFFHLAKGVQHLVWDTGHALKVQSATMGAIVCIAFAVAATLAVWIIAAMTGAL